MGACYPPTMRAADPPDIRLICFDLGGVVVRTCASSQEGCARAGVPYRPEIETPEVRARLEQAGAAYELGRCSTAEYFARAEAALDSRQPATEVALVHDAWMLPSGNILYADGGVTEVTPDHKVVFQYKSEVSKGGGASSFCPGNDCQPPISELHHAKPLAQKLRPVGTWRRSTSQVG